jgi:2-alkenal reductase
MSGKIGLVLLTVTLALGAGAAAGALAALWVVQERPAGLGGVLGGAGIGQSLTDLGSSAVAQLASQSQLDPGEDDAVLAAVRATRPAVVTVWNWRYVRRSFFSPPRLENVTSGSGVIFDPRGYIATNTHVISGAEAVEVVFLDGRTAPATVVRWDDDLEIAILHVEAELPAVAPLADSATLEPGMRVLAIGSPLGTEYQNTVTTGIVAGLNRRVKQWGLDGRTLQVREVDVVGVPLIQTDAAINHGNSGGPLVNLRGEVVGLNTLIVRSDGQSAVEGLGFAVPSNVVHALADEWIDGIPRGWLGADFSTIDPSIAREQDLPYSAGATLTRVWPQTPAAAAGLQAGDHVVAIDGTPLDLDHALADLLWRYRAGQTVRLSVDRAGTPLALEVELGPVPTASP